MSSDNALPPPVPRHARLQALQAAVATPRPRSSSLAHVMGQGFSKSPASTPQKGIASLANTGIKLKRAFAARRKKSEDVTSKLSGGSSHSDREQDSLVDTSSRPIAVAAPPSEVTATSSPTVTQHTKLTLKLITQVLPNGSKSSTPKSPSPIPPPTPPKPASMQGAKLSPPSTATQNADNRGSIIPISPGISSAVQFMRIGEEQREQERLATLEKEKKATEKEQEESGNESDKGKQEGKEKHAEVETDRKERNRERLPNDENEEKLKQGWRKSDSTMSHHTIRPGPPLGSRSSRPVSMAESLQSTHTIVPVNKRLSALLTDAGFQTPEEDDSSVKSTSEELVSIPQAVPSAESSPTASLKKTKNRRSMSLNLGSLTHKTHLPAPPTTSASVGSLAELHHPSKSLPETYTAPLIQTTMTRETPTLTRAAANGIISPSSAGPQTTGNNIRGRLAAWSATTRPSDDQRDPSAPSPARRAHMPHLPPSSFSRQTPSPQPTGLRQTAISITGGLAPAAGLAKRAVEKMGRAWGGLSSSSSNSGYSSSSSSTGHSTSDNNLRRTNSNTGGSVASLSSKGKSRRTPEAPSGSWSMSSSSNSTSDSEAFVGPSLGKKIRGPMRGYYPGHGGVVFGKRLDVVVRETGIGVGLPGHHNHEGKRGHEGKGVVDKDNLVALEHRLLPALVVRCAQHLLVWGVHEEGLFRVNGRPSHVSRLRHEFDSGADYDMKECSPGELDPHAVASIFKAFLRELPEPILTHSLIPYFEAALFQESAANAEAQASAPPMKLGAKGPTLPSGPKSGFNGLRKPPSLSTLAMPNFSGMRPPSVNFRRALKSLLNQLPAENRDLIRTVTELIKATAREHRETKMPLSNLLLVFCPSLNMNPPLLRALCEAEEIWEGPPIESPVLDIKRESVVLDIKPESTSVDASMESESGDDNDQVFSDAQEVLDEESSIVVDESFDVEPSNPVLQCSVSKREGPRSRPVGPRSAGATPGSTTSPTVSSDSLATSSEGHSLLSPSDRGFVSSPPPLSSSTESLPTASSSSAAPSLTDVHIQRETYDLKGGELGSVEIANDLENDILNPRRYMVNTGPVEFPRTSGSTPATPLSRRSIIPLSLSDLGTVSGSNSMPPSPSLGRRLKRPSLHLLFNKRSASPLSSPSTSGAPYISSPQTARTVSESSISTPLTATTAVTAPQSSLFESPPVLDTTIESTPLRLEMGFDPPPTALPEQENDKSASPLSTDSIEARVYAPTPPPGTVPIAKLYSASASTLSLTLDPNVEEQESNSHIHLYSSHLRPIPARQHAMAKKSTTSLNHLKLLDDEEEDWTQSVLIAAGAGHS
ncbi:RhoGAP-domain-containing protein [Marasmius fiardii PR-910]|nr:RhoGAP-domain-containing protein [Marasmius fiardii PR-910]